MNERMCVWDKGRSSPVVQAEEEKQTMMSCHVCELACTLTQICRDGLCSWVVRFSTQAPMKFKVDVNVLSVEDVPGKAERVVVVVVRYHMRVHIRIRMRTDHGKRERENFSLAVLYLYLCIEERKES